MAKLSLEETFRLLALEEQRAQSIPPEPDKRHLRRCLYCGKEYLPTRSWQKYCTTEHREKSRNKFPFAEDFQTDPNLLSIEQYYNTHIAPDIATLHDVRRGLLTAAELPPTFHDRLRDHLAHTMPAEDEQDIIGFLDPQATPTHDPEPLYADDSDLRAMFNLPPTDTGGTGGTGGM